MGEHGVFGKDPRSDRTSVEYLEATLDQAFTASGIAVGVFADRAPESFEELQAVVEAKRNPECGVSEDIDIVMEIIGGCEDRDEITRALPFYEGSIVFILPE